MFKYRVCLYIYIYMQIHVSIHNIYACKYIGFYAYGDVIGIQAPVLNLYNHVLALSLTEMESPGPSRALKLGTHYSSNTS